MIPITCDQATVPLVTVEANRHVLSYHALSYLPAMIPITCDQVRHCRTVVVTEAKDRETLYLLKISRTFVLELSNS